MHRGCRRGSRPRRSRGACARSRAGAGSCRPIACWPRWRTWGSRRPSWVLWAGCRSTARRPGPSSTATGCGSSAGSCRSSCTRPSSATRATGPRGRGQLAAAGADVFVAALVADARLVGAPDPRRRRVEARRRAPARARRPRRARRAWTLVAAPARRHARRDRRGRRAGARAHRRALVLRQRPPADRRRRPGRVRPGPRRPHRPRPPQGRRRAPRGGRPRRRALPRRRHAGRPVPPARRGRRADRRGRPAFSTRPATSAGSCSNRTSRSPARSPRPAKVLPSMCSGASSSCQ